MNIIVQTPRLIAREFISDEKELLVDLYRDDRITRHVAKRSEETTRQQFDEALVEYNNGSGLGRWGIFNVTNGDFMGVCILKPADSDPNHIELGYVLAYQYWGMGLATELAKALVIYGFEQKRLAEICACTNHDNIASQNVLLKAGLARHGDIFWHGLNLAFFKMKQPGRSAP